MPSRPVLEIIKNRDFLLATPDKSVRAVAAHMKKFGAAAVLVANESDGKLIGICTERDLTYKVLAEGLDPKTPVSEVMTRDPQGVGTEKTFGYALHLMHEGGFRHMPVLDPQGRPVGLVSSRDALGLDILNFRKEVEHKEALAEIL
jgi:CBS domain-containing protein